MVSGPFVKFGFETGERVGDTEFGGVDRVEVDEAYLASIPTLVRPCWIHGAEVKRDTDVFIHEYGEEESSVSSTADFLSVSFKVVVILLSRREVNGSEIVTTMPTDDDTSIVKVKWNFVVDDTNFVELTVVGRRERGNEDEVSFGGKGESLSTGRIEFLKGMEVLFEGRVSRLVNHSALLSTHSEIVGGLSVRFWSLTSSR